MDDTNALTQEGFPTLDNYGEEANAQLAMFSLEDLSVKTTQSVDKLQDQLKQAREMVDENFAASSQYKEQEERVKKEAKELKAIKEHIKKRPEVISLESRVKEIRNEIKEKRETVSAYLSEYVAQSRATEIIKDGVVYDIKTVAKLVLRKQ